MQVWSGAVAAACGQSDLLPRANGLSVRHGHAVSAQVVIPGVMCSAVEEYDVVRRLPLRRRVSIEFAVMPVRHSAVQRRKDRNSDVLFAERPQIDVMSVVPIIGEIRTIPIEDSTRGI